jgi:5-methylcytosine-specific restriction enzyme subunit McrC
MKPHIFYEYETIDDEEIVKYIQTHKELHPFFKEEWGEVKPLQYCGVLHIQGRDIYILPKITRREDTRNLDIFIYMLLYAYDIKLQNQDFAKAKNYKSNFILEVLVQHFAKELLREFTKGLYKTYITKEENLTTLRGKYLQTQNIRHNFTKSKIYCEFDEFSADNELNQFFLFALKHLLPCVQNKKLLKEAILVLDEVSEREFDISRSAIHFNRLNARFESSYEIAMMLLNRLIPMFSEGERSFAFLFDMNELFENFIGKIYKDIDISTELQKRDHYGSLVLKPDIVTKSMIIDTKYKKVSIREELRVPDKYQMFVYGTNFQQSKTMLLYPKHKQDIREDLQLGKNDTMIELKMRSIDLDFDGEYEEFLDEIRGRVGNLI